MRALLKTFTRRRGLLLALLSGLIAILACDASNTAINGIPLYLCPSSTPRPTDTPLPPDPPSFPWAFSANTDYSEVDPTSDLVTVQYLAQSANVITLTYYGYFSDGTLWQGLTSWPIAYPLMGQPGIGNGTFFVSIPPTITYAVILLTEGRFGQTYTFTIYRYAYPVRGVPTFPPCCLPSPIYPTARPTYTPYPSPTTFQMRSDYYLGDAVYTAVGSVRLRLRLVSVATVYLTPDDTAFVWHFELKNIGLLEYAFVPFLQTYISQVTFSDGSMADGVWGPSLAMAQSLGIDTPVTPISLVPGAVGQVGFVTGGFHPNEQANFISFVLNPTIRDGSAPTVVPGSNIIRFRTQTNPFCHGDIAEPTNSP